IWFSGYEWHVRGGGFGGPGPNFWEPDNVWVDDHGYLHLTISYQNGHWTCAEINLTQPLGFGIYQFQVIGRIDQLDRNVVLGLFTYGGPDGTNEIDIEFGQWGNPNAPRGHYTVWPAQFVPDYKNTTQAFPVALNGSYTTHRFTWSSDQILFQSLHGHHDDDTNEFARWDFSPDDPWVYLPQAAAPVNLNLWL